MTRPASCGPLINSFKVLVTILASFVFGKLKQLLLSQIARKP